MADFEDSRNLVDPSPLAWWEWDVTADRVTFNDLKATMLGYDPADFSGGGYRAFTQLVHPDDLEKTMTAMVRVLDGTSDLYQVDYRILAKDGTYRWYMDRGTVQRRGASGRPVFLRGIVIDLGREGRISGGPETVIELLGRSVRNWAVTGESFAVVCSCCRRVKVRDQDWVPVSPELMAVVGQQVSHGLCPRCIRGLYPEWSARVLDREPPAASAG